LTTLTTCKTEIELELEKELELEQQQEEKNAAAGVGKNIIFEKLKEAFGEMAISGTVTQEVEDLLKVHGQRLVLYALDETILNGGRSIRYTRSILERWQGQGLKTIEQVKQNKVEFEAMKQPRQDNPDNFPE
ncbi:DnaD domain-containing protein, partial [Streptococcus suis]